MIRQILMCHERQDLTVAYDAPTQSMNVFGCPKDSDFGAQSTACQIQMSRYESQARLRISSGGCSRPTIIRTYWLSGD